MNTDKILSIPAEEYHAESRNGSIAQLPMSRDFLQSSENKCNRAKFLRLIGWWTKLIADEPGEKKDSDLHRIFDGK